MRSSWMHRLVGALALLVAAVGSGPAAAQQQTGTITGRVVDRATQQPIPAASVTIVGTPRGTQTGDDGRYRIAGQPTGTVQLRALRLGYEAVTQTVTITAGGTATADFVLAPAAVRLDEVVTTATGETQRRRETGNAVSTVQTAPERLAVTTNIAQLLTAQAPGVYINSSGGTTGSASRIRIRGANSVSLSNEPLLIVDGVRANNDIAGTGTIGVGGQQSSRINDINPDDIESIEIIKGPAAAALYGTAAANGVLQIRTKRGRPGKTKWTTYAEGGTQEDVQDYPANFSQIGRRVDNNARVTGCTLDAQIRRVCTPVPDSLASFNPLEQATPFVRGYRTSYGLNASGGSDAASFFLSGDFDRDQGVFEPNTFRRVSLRANLTSQLLNNLNAQLSTSYISSRLGFPQNDNNILGVSAGLLGSAFDNAARGYAAGQTPQSLYAGMHTQENVERFIGSVTSTWQPLSWLSATGQAGVDFFDRRNNETVDPGEVFFNSTYQEGYRQANSARIWNYTANANATANFDLTPTLRSTTTTGVQFTKELVNGQRAFGAKLLAGTGSLQGTSARFAVGETNTDNKTVGGILQQQIAWRDRLFVSAAARTDNNSAFGANFGWIVYPAASLSYVISEEGFFPQNPVLTSLRLRTAYGESGQRPNFRDAITFFNVQTVTVSGIDVPGITVGGTGNSDLKPERSREYEMGFEAGFFQQRLGLEMTYYNKRTNDLLIARPLPPSLGLTTSQFANLGQSKNEGLELMLNAIAWDRSNVRLELNVTGSTNKNRLVSIGKLPNGDPIPPIVFGIQRHREGYALGGYWDEQYSFQDKNGDGIISRANCPGQAAVAGGPECEVILDTLSYLGNPLPTREMSFTPRLTLFERVELSALFDYKGGFKQFNNTSRFRCNFGNCQEAYDRSAPLWIQARNVAHLMNTDAGYVEDADYTKLREVAVSFLAPRSWATRARVEGLRLTLAGRNLKTWTDYTGFDPEVNSTPTALFSSSDFLTQPPLRVLSARLTVTF
jgi:TonB-linked SusC/RagA family outer membrane protein